jgi:hypothetical protein
LGALIARINEPTIGIREISRSELPQIALNFVDPVLDRQPSGP